uniref:Diamine acetyltransferase 2-like n=1 Tax=Petromyzon marinus TaxID=7757 RepID=A0AAJ7XII1_PETMA|nr:diamine acetyltransferase 2-like [Petromyzon marinus]
MSGRFQVRQAAERDCADIVRLIKELVTYEKLLGQVDITEEDLRRDGFGGKPLFHCLVAEVQHQHQQGAMLIGYALFYDTYCTWVGRSAYLEGLYVTTEFRGRGVGKDLLRKVAEVCRLNGCVRLTLSVLDWNAPAMDFYRARGASDLTAAEGWHLVRFQGAALASLAVVGGGTAVVGGGTAVVGGGTAVVGGGLTSPAPATPSS